MENKAAAAAGRLGDREKRLVLHSHLGFPGKKKKKKKRKKKYSPQPNADDQGGRKEEVERETTCFACTCYVLILLKLPRLRKTRNAVGRARAGSYPMEEGGF